MISSICFTPPSSTRTAAASLWFSRRPVSPNLRPRYYWYLPEQRKAKLTQRKIGRCRAAELSQDAPFAVAIGACILNSLVFPAALQDNNNNEEEEDSVVDSTDARFAVMGIISFIPYFNWLSWVFAWLDTGKRRYVVYSLVYLAPYLRSNLSLSPEESWLPIASILLCIIHIQLEVSVQNGDLQAFRLFTDAAKHLSSVTSKREVQIKDDKRDFQEGMKDDKNLPDAQEKSRNDIREWGVPPKPFEDSDYLDEDGEVDRRKH